MEFSVRGDSWPGPKLRPAAQPEARVQLRLFLRRSDSGFRIVLDPGGW